MMGQISKGFCTLNSQSKILDNYTSDMDFEQIDTESDCPTCYNNNDKPGYQVTRNRPPFM